MVSKSRSSSFDLAQTARLGEAVDDQSARAQMPDWLSTKTKPQQHHGTEVSPPVDERSGARVAALLWVGDPHRDFLPAVASEKDLHEQVRLNLIPTQPGLVQVDLGIVEHPETVGLEAAGGVGDALTYGQRGEPGEQLNEQQPVPRHIDLRATGKEARTANKIEALFDQRVNKILNLMRIMLPVRRHYCGHIDPPLAQELESVADRWARAGPLGVVYDICRHDPEEPGQPFFLVIGGNDHRDLEPANHGSRPVPAITGRSSLEP